MNWMDVCVIIIIAISGLKGLGEGLVLSLFNIAGYIAACIIAKIYYPSLYKIIVENTNWTTKIQGFVYNNMSFLSNNNLQAQGESNQSIFEMMNLPKALENLMLNSAFLEDYSESVVYNINTYISQILAKIIIELLSIIIIFLIAKLVLNILSTILNGIASLPIITQFNRLGGLMFGVLKGVFIIFIFTAIMVPAASIFPNSYLVNTLETSSIAKPFYDYNILLYMIKNIVTYGGSQIVSGF